MIGQMLAIVVGKRSLSHAGARARRMVISPPSTTGGKRRRIELTVEQAARLFSTTPEKVRRAARRGEVQAEERDGRVVVFVDSERDTLTGPQAARLLGVGAPTIRRDVVTGRLEGRRVDHGYEILVAAILADRRCPADVRELLDPDSRRRAEPERSTTRVNGPLAGRLSLPVYVRLRPEEAEALAAGVERFGSQRAAIGAALAQLGETLPLESELRRLQGELEQRDEKVAHARDEARKAKERAARVPDELYCDGCRAFVPLEQLEAEDDREHGGLVWRHRHQGLDVLRHGSASLVGRRKYG
jgi:hypothetical protein